MNFIKYICLIFIINLSFSINNVLYSAEGDTNSSTNTTLDNTTQQTSNANNGVSVSNSDVSQDAPIVSDTPVANTTEGDVITSSSDLNENEVLRDENTIDSTSSNQEQVVDPAQPIEKIPAGPTPAELAKIREEQKAKERAELDSFLKSYDFLSDLNLDTEDNFVLPGDAEKYIIFETPYKLIIIELYLSEAPKTTAFIKKLIREKFYDNTTFFRLIPNYIIQGGDPSDSSYGGYGKPRPAEINPDLKFQRGTIAMSNIGDLQSDDSQFFITFNSFPWLDGKYTIFGKVISGINYLERLTGRYDNDGFLDAPLLIIKAYVYSDYLAMKAEEKAKAKAEAEAKANEKIKKMQEEIKTKQKEATAQAKATEASRNEKNVDGKLDANTTATPTATGKPAGGKAGAQTTATATGTNTSPSSANSSNNKVVPPSNQSSQSGANNNTSTTNNTTTNTTTNTSPTTTNNTTNTSPATNTNVAPNTENTTNRPNRTSAYGPR